MLAGTRLPSGCGYSTVLPDMDFETYSEAGYYFDAAAKNGLGQWRSITKSPPHGIGAVGAPAYSEHPSTEVLSLAYDLKDGLGSRLWVPGMAPPSDLFAHIAAGGLIEAWNSAFEWHIWTNVCAARMGWPALPYWQLRDAMAKARAWSIPGALGKAAEVTQVQDQKIDDGKRLLNKFSKPRSPTKNDPRRRIRPEEDHIDAAKLYDYNIGDIKSESAVSALVADLSGDELELWLLDQCINFRGVSIDRVALDNCKIIIEQATAKYTAELVQITGGTVQGASEIQKITGWLGGQGLPMASLDAEHVEEALKLETLTPQIRRVLEIRASLGAASVKKLFAIDRRVSRDGRLKDLFAFCGADRTGRFAGRGPQPQNLPNSGPAVKQCDPIGGCGKHYDKRLDVCPWCGASSAFAEEPDWNVGAVEDALQAIATGDLATVEHFFGDAVAVVSGCLRGLFSASEGCDLICSDYSAIEAVVLAALAGEEWRLDVFRTHGLIYEMSASKITGVPFEEFKRHKEETNEHHPMRKKVGKVAELACFHPDTQVLTRRGYVRIMDVTFRDLLWDGVEWVRNDGAINKGARETILVDGVKMTSEHPISLGHSWKEAKELVSNESILNQALAIGSENLPWCAKSNAITCMARRSNAPAGTALTSSAIQTFTRVNPLAVQFAAGVKAAKHMLRNTSNTQKSCRTTSTVAGYAIGSAPLSAGATTLITEGIETTGEEVFSCAKNGADQNARFSNMYKHLRGGMMRRLKWTASTLTAAIPSETYDSFLNLRTVGTKDPSSRCKRESTTLSDVYDIVNAGPRNRFTIKTDSGHMIVHNSGYQGGYGAWLAFGADKHLNEQEIRDAIKRWRTESPNIVKFWYGLEDAAVAAVQNPGQCYSYRGITYGVKDDVLYCQLLSGRKLSYHQPRLHPDKTSWGKNVLKLTYMGWNTDYKKGPKGWMRLDTYGGKLTENVVQATARDILTYALKNVERAGYSVVLHVHDEIVSEVMAGTGSIEEFERIMATLPDWCADWPIKAAGGWRGKRYRKD